MKIMFLGNNLLGLQIVTWLMQEHEDIVALSLHPEPKQKYGKEIVQAAQLKQSEIFDGYAINEPHVLMGIRKLGVDIAVSILFDYILSDEFLDIFPKGVINLHPSFLPYNRGQFPNVWSIVDHTPAGVSLHYIDKGIDTGDIIAQQQVPVEAIDTGKSLYHKLEQAGLELFKKTWPLIRSGKSTGKPQIAQSWTYHRTRDVDRIDEVDLERCYKARDLIDILRARTFSPYPGAYFVKDGLKIYMRLELFDENELNKGRNG